MKKLNIVFFSLCFLGALIAEAYFIQAGASNWFSIIALGIVVLITGYLWMDAVRTKLSDSGKEIKNYIDRMYQEETERWNDRLNELQNLQKASYTATKKNTVTLSEQLDGLLNRMNALEESQTRALQKLTDMQLKALEGQKKSLSLQVNYDKENTRQLINAIGEAKNSEETLELLNKITEQLENSTYILCQELKNLSIKVETPSTVGSYTEDEWNMDREPKVENLTETGWNVDAEVELDTDGNSWDNRTEPVIEELETDWNGEEKPDTNMADLALADEQEQYTVPTVDNKEAEMEEAALDTDWNSVDLDLNNIIEGWNEEPLEEKTPDMISSQEETIPEVVDVVDEPVTVEEQSAKPEIKPLYDDPNKALSADEIAALFASFGQ
jgi:hypothetical protein